MKHFILGVLTTLATLVLVAGLGAYAWLNADDPPQNTPTPVADVPRVAADEAAHAHAALFQKRIETPAPGVHVAIGYGLANVVLIEAPLGLILFDTLESIRAAEALLPWIDEMRKATGKDITDIVFTHNHVDHVFGAGVFPRGQDTRPKVWAHTETEARVGEVVNVLAPILYTRSMRMFGTFLPDDNFVHNGIGARLLRDNDDGFYFLSPTDEISERSVLDLAGERVILQHAPGETEDQLVAFLPERSVLLAADNWYRAFPNLYTIRGTPYRDPIRWAASLDVMRGFEADVMIPQHGLPVIGRAAIADRLQTTRDAIQFVHDETVRLMNAGLTADEIAAQIVLPQHLRDLPHLREHYGRVAWAARSVFNGKLGWFSGDPADLRPPSPRETARRMAELAGGSAALETAAQEALSRDDHAWALRLASHLARLEVDGAQELRAEALRGLAAVETSSSGRNYFLTAAAEAEGFALPPVSVGDTPTEALDAIPVTNFLRTLTVSLKAVDTSDVEAAWGFSFTDGGAYTIRIRNGVAFHVPGLAEDRQGTLITTESAFRQLAFGLRKPADMLVRGDLRVEGSLADLTAFLGYFDPPV